MKISRIKDVKLPIRGTSKSAGLDFFVPNDFEAITLATGESIKIGSGIKVEIPENHVLIAFNKSGIALSGLSVGACVIDEDYEHEISLHVFNRSNNNVTIKPGQKLVQFLLQPIVYEEVIEVNEDELYINSTSERTGGFGSTGLY